MTQAKSKSVLFLKISLWLVQSFLALTFISGAIMKLFLPEKLPWIWIKENPNLATTSAIFDLLAGLGIILPSLLQTKPKLTVYAAYGAILLMTSASVFHVLRGEGNEIGFNMLILILAAFVAWGRKV